MSIYLWISIIFLVILVSFLLFFFIVFIKVIKFSKNIGISQEQFKEMIETSEYEAKYRIKSIAGMTSILLPQIIKDFPSFSEGELFNKVETSLLLIFEALEKKKVGRNKELSFIRLNLEEKIKDLKENKIDVCFDEVVFHKHVIDKYIKDKGIVMIQVQTSLEYFYQEYKNGKEVVKRNEWKKQTSYTTEFVYVFDEDDFSEGKTLLGVRCPNCGAPVKNLGNKTCSYCSSALVDINMRTWFISSYVEDQR